MTVKNTEARYWSLVDKRGPNECWVWRGYRHKQGYGRFKWRGQNRLAHRLSVQFTTGKEIPWQVHALHRCDNPPCVNPEHIFLGNHRANMADMRRKGRHAHGERSGLAVLTEKEVKRLRVIGASKLLTHSEMALIFGIDKSNVTRVLNRQNWAHSESEAV